LSRNREWSGWRISTSGTGWYSVSSCYSAENVEKQRGIGVFAEYRALKKQLSWLGRAGTEPCHNPGGVPPRSGVILSGLRKELSENFGIVFTSLYTITNAPIGRFALPEKGHMKHTSISSPIDSTRRPQLDHFATP
jgi:hypothetical protein